MAQYCIKGRQGEAIERHDFTLGDLFEAQGYDVKTLGLQVNAKCEDMSPDTMLKLVNKWNRLSVPGSETVYYLEEDPAWL